MFCGPESETPTLIKMKFDLSKCTCSVLCCDKFPIDRSNVLPQVGEKLESAKLCMKY